ncbi:hypothetical protein [Desulfovibrio ferrophilus]|uniref:Uncharacterized protein n=1 Tax=Desulfovibrio ferrophilus TaxID=241368 RepID=A0A2Z6AW38_9BACT|nr:hypothetical protein [Desulfovibrio ferrophilus]BBD07452.1 uncharacterized protein DFE_0726 [Desulfovibrio ferrophilus]
MKECMLFIKDWETDPNEVKSVFEHFKTVLESFEGADVSFNARPNVSYSLRGACPEHERDLFVMVDVVDDDPAERWLSVCFYDDQITDADDIGDWVPEGLNGSDARCFDVSTSDKDLVAYTEARIREAWQAARGA